MKETLKSIGGFAFGILMMFVMLTLVILFFYGAAWVGEKVIPVLEWITVIGFMLLVVIGSPLAIFRNTRHITGQGWFYWSYALGFPRQQKIHHRRLKRSPARFVEMVQ